MMMMMMMMMGLWKIQKNPQDPPLSSPQKQRNLHTLRVNLKDLQGFVNGSMRDSGIGDWEEEEEEKRGGRRVVGGGAFG